MEEKEDGFTIVELLIVMTIMSILASFSVLTYMKYQQKSKVTSYALPVVKACAFDAAGLCQELQLSSNSTIDLSSLKNCQNTVIPGGNLAISISGSVECTTDGVIADGTVKGSLDQVREYSAFCILNHKGIECTVR